MILSWDIVWVICTPLQTSKRKGKTWSDHLIRLSFLKASHLTDFQPNFGSFWKRLCFDETVDIRQTGEWENTAIQWAISDTGLIIDYRRWSLICSMQLCFVLCLCLVQIAPRLAVLAEQKTTDIHHFPLLRLSDASCWVSATLSDCILSDLHVKRLRYWS